MDFRDYLPFLCYWKNVLEGKAYSERMVGRLVYLYCFGIYPSSIITLCGITDRLRCSILLSQ